MTVRGGPPGRDRRLDGGAPRRVTVVDVLAVLSVPVVLLAVASFPRPVRLSLALSYPAPTVLTMYASHFVHLEVPHLLANLLVYLTVVSVTLLTSVRSDHRSRFYATFFTVLLAFPFALSALNVALARPRVGFGFSGLNMAFLGVLPHALAGYLDERNPDAELSTSPLPFFVATTVIAFRAVPLGTWSLLVGAGSLVAVLLCLRTLSRAGALESIDCGADGGIVVVGACLFVLLPFVAFPTGVTGENSVLNLFSHFLGFCFGYIVPYVTFRVVSFDRPDPGTAA